MACHPRRQDAAPLPNTDRGLRSSPGVKNNLLKRGGPAARDISGRPVRTAMYKKERFWAVILLLYDEKVYPKKYFQKFSKNVGKWPDRRRSNALLFAQNGLWGRKRPPTQTRCRQGVFSVFGPFFVFF